MGVKLKCTGFALFCAVWMVQGARAENCRLSLSQSRIDYGVVHREALLESPSVTLGSRTLHLNVLCAEPSAIALRFIGAADGRGFRFGQQGRLRLSLKHAQMDGRAVDWALAHLPGEAARGQLLPGQVLVARAVGKRLTAQVDVDTDVPADTFQVRYQTVLESQGSFELVSPAVPLSR
ncbi:hypothetical protein EXW72_15030 [Pseudomonas sp. BCA14]|uniref:hypothetical protein n=1 Tax=unclassified Pseudomonas TaxID=196821 RepID=UPI00106E5832|nr:MULTISPECIES: hypothetical protein [unclassified Pseudomonas]TFF07373.1 hypothetical protein EXW70_16175 [Pseudomonas sp. JMN1]TFF10934.1 hypothetical protein EXW71_14255 [Pseudomonas sp. BCA17]TFF22545.1 hypothetical protein EXW73_19735 [Pseudomonas sp. BCA13]TFF26397.1 hypothetical protein EXW72_15030 [Pseudomonas sp. BCA14]